MRGVKVTTIEHGTDRGSYQHHRRDEEPCAPCKRAHADAVRARAQRKRALQVPDEHGTFGAAMAGCRCVQCRPWAPFRHGRGAYDHNVCRCRVCTEAKLIAAATYREAHPDVIERLAPRSNRAREAVQSVSLEGADRA